VHHQLTTYGDVLEKHAHKARYCSDAWSEAVNELALSWLESGQWHRSCENPNAVKAAIRNKMRDMYRTHCRYEHVEEEVEKLSVNSDEARMVASDCLAALGKMLHQDHLRVLVLDAEGYKGPELAIELDISHDSARTRLHRARKAAHSELSNLDMAA
jgi:DNA-directed RNA polymerase specialized sigma24 family protein